jgi:hypothetical protein
MKTDREKALHYVSNALKPGDDFTSKDLGHFIGRQKSETLRVIQWLLDQGYVEKRGNGPATGYMVLESAHPEDRKMKAKLETLKPDPIVAASQTETFYASDFDSDESIHALQPDPAMVKYLDPEVLSKRNEEFSEQVKRTREAVREAVLQSDVELKEKSHKSHVIKSWKYSQITSKLEETRENLVQWHRSQSRWNNELREAGRSTLINEGLLHYIDGQLDLVEQLLKDV